MKLVKSDWCSKLSGENIEALLHIKVEGPKIKQFMKEHSSDAAAFQCDVKEQIRWYRKWGKKLFQKD